MSLIPLHLTVNNLKYNGAKFSVSSAGTDANGNTFLNLKSDSTSAINITETKIKVLHTTSKDVSAYFEGGTDIFDNQTEHFGSNRIVLKELNKHGYLNKDAKQANTLLNGAITNSATSITVDTTTGFPTSGTLLIGTEEMTYTGKTSTTFTGLTRNTNSAGAATALDDATVKLASFSERYF